MADQQISLQSLSLEQLNGLKSQLENELRQYSSSFGGLKQAQARFKESKLAIENLTPESEGKNILIPLTSSMYVPGKLKNVSNVLVDVGTGYYVEKNVKDASQFMERKVNFLQGNTDSLQELIEGKRNDLEMVIGFMQQKLKGLEK